MFERLGKFEIQRLLGQGAMGEVYLGYDLVLRRQVAIKTILPVAAHGADAIARFEREARAAGMLNHPNIVTIHEFGEDQGVLFIAMEYVQGRDLGELLLTNAISRLDSLEVLAQVCDGLNYAHCKGVIHRDIKPSNVHVTRDGKRLHAKVMDFGVARLNDSEMTVTGMVLGTVSYMAPEYIRTGQLDSRSDLFAVGVMLYEALSGRKPFTGDTTPTILYKIIHEPADPIDLQTFSGISPATRSILDRALAKEPDERFQTGEAFAKALRAAKDPTWQGEVDHGTSPEITAPALERDDTTQLTRGIGGSTGLPATTSARPTQGTPARKWAIAAGVALASGLLILGFLALWGRQSAAKPEVPAAPSATAPVATPATPVPPVPAPPTAPSTVPARLTPPPVLPPPATAPNGAAPQLPPSTTPPGPETTKPIVYFERFNIEADVIIDNRDRLIVEGKPGDPMRKAITALAVGRHHLHYQVSDVVRYHADIEIKPGDNYVRPNFQYDTLPGLTRNLSYQEGKDNTYTFTQSQPYLTYDPKGLPVQNNGDLVLNVKLSKDPQNSQTLIARFAWQISNYGRELSRGSAEGSHPAGAPKTEEKKVVYSDESITYYLKYYMVDNAIQVELTGIYGR